MDAFQPVESALQFNMDAMKEPLPYAAQDPRSAAYVIIKTPAGIYQSDSIRIDEAAGEITVEADGARILLDRRNVAVYQDPETPSIYPSALCDVRFTN